MNLTVTLSLVVAAAALAAFAGWRGSRPSEPHRGVRMVPWRMIMLLSGTVVFLLLIHIGALLGVPQRAY